MSHDSLWVRLKKARVFQVVGVYLGASWGVLEVADLLQDSLNLPQWVVPVALLLLAIGLLIILATAWVQSLPDTRDRAASGELPGAWEIAPGGFFHAIKEGELPHLTWGRAVIGGVAAMWLLFGFAGLYVVLKDRGETFTPPDLVAGEAADAIAIVPFTTRGADLDIWREGMVDLFAMSLDGVGGFRTIDSRTVMARWRDVVGEGAESEPDLATVREVARRAGARYVMTGNVVSFGDDLQLQAELVGVDSGDDLGSGRVQGPVDSVPALVDRLSIQVAGDLLRASGSDVLTAHRAASRATSSLPALKAYLEGESHYRHADFGPAREAYDRALAADSTFALAHLRLSQVYGWMESINSERGLDQTLAAARLASNLPARDQAIVEGFTAFREGDIEAIDLVEQTADKYPDDPEAQYLLGEFYYHYGPTLMVDLEQTREAFRKAIDLDPDFGPYYVHAIQLATADVDTTAARQLLGRFEQLSGSDAEDWRLAVDLTVGDSLEQVEARSRIPTMDDRALQQIVFSLFAATERPVSLLPVIEELSKRDAIGRWVLDWTLFNAGKLQERRERIGELLPEAPATGPAYEAWRWAGGPRPPDDAVYPVTRCREIPDAIGRLYCTLELGSWRVELGDGAAASELAGELTAAGDSLAAAGDSIVGTEYARAAEAIEAYALRVPGGPERAIEALVPLTKRSSDNADEWIRGWLAELYREEGRLREAIPYYESLRRDGLVAYGAFRLGQLYEALGRPDEAVDAYKTFLQTWEEADPDLPWLDEARSSLEALLPEQG